MGALYFRYHLDYFIPRTETLEEAMLLAWAAYNRGRGGVLRTAARVGKGLAWSLVKDHLPTETINYTRRIQQMSRRLRR